METVATKQMSNIYLVDVTRNPFSFVDVDDKPFRVHSQLFTSLRPTQHALKIKEKPSAKCILPKISLIAERLRIRNIYFWL